MDLRGGKAATPGTRAGRGADPDRRPRGTPRQQDGHPGHVPGPGSDPGVAASREDSGVTKKLQVIEALQQRLNQLGAGRLLVDGVFGARTAAAYATALLAGAIARDDDLVRMARLAVAASAPLRRDLDVFYGPPPRDVIAAPTETNPEAIRLTHGSTWATLNLDAVDLPIVGVRRLHIRAAPAFIGWLAEVAYYLYTHPDETWRIEEFQCVAMRFMRGRLGRLSDHARGCATDVNPVANPRGKPGSLPAWFVEIAEAWGSSGAGDGAASAATTCTLPGAGCEGGHMGRTQPTVEKSPALGVLVELVMGLVGRKGDGPADSLWTSRTLWVLLLAVLANVGQRYLGWVFAPEDQLLALAGIALLLRLVTGTPLAWTAASPDDIPTAPRRLRRQIARDLAKSVTNRTNVNLLVAGLCLLTMMSCTGFQVRCDDPTLVLRDTATPASTRIAFLCGDVEVGSQDVDLAGLAGVTALCGEPSLVLRGEDAQGNTRVDLQCNGQVLATWRLPLKELMRQVRGDAQPTLRPAVLVPSGTCEAPVPGPAEVQ